ncbi:hypothetical protein BJ138DRAFT_1128425 [Hygrophoropsis aurantiaca]|uniref:Uncharacterized protein n=1 Tax=Hygrophoropsis aurantiaca TaxID=72124 RepID=A0ACB8A615_9AGAM|nr:hypothetical protein BJ138DRAFT_1128425 [Hygrophoropsis aurantiaca]
MGNYTRHHDTSVRNKLKIVEDEVLELKKQEFDLLTRLRLLQGTITRKRVLAGSLKNSLALVSRLPNEILLACFGQAVQDWVDKNDGADERKIAEMGHSNWEKDIDFKLPCTPIFAISHVSHDWRQLAINDPSLWTNLIITPKFERHWDIFQDFLHRAKGIPIAAKFRSFGPDRTPSSAGILLMEAIMSLLHAQKINELSFLASGPVCSVLLSRMVEQRPRSPPSVGFSRLTTLSIFSLEYSEVLTFSHLRQLLSVIPQLKTLELQPHESLSAADADKSVIALPVLENLTIIDANPFACKLLDSLCAPNVRQLKLLIWDDWIPEVLDITSCLFMNNSNNLQSGLRLPKFPGVRNLTLSSSADYDNLNTNLITAFSQVTHLTLGSPSLFYEIEEPSSPPPPTFQWLQHLTLDFSFDSIYLDLDSRSGFTWLQKPQDQADRRPLLISVFDRSGLMEDANTHLFRYYKELQQYGEFDGSSSRLKEFMRWQADGEPEILG